MNKQQLIDKAIDFLEGNFPKLRICDYFTLNDVLHLGRHNMRHVVVCTRQEFEARKAEREKDKQEAEKMFGMLNSSASLPEQHWYDYENQKALRLPPVGEVVFFGLNDNRRKVVIIAHDLNAAILRDETCHDDDVDYYAAAQELFRPIDWDKLRIAAVNELAGIIESYCVNVVSATRITAAILAAGYRKCHNKTPSDKE